MNDYKYGVFTLKRFLTPFPLPAYHHERGMSPVHDWIDWIGGLPFEVAKPDDVIRFHEQRSFELLKLTRTKSLGCNQFVFRLKPT